MSAASAAAAVQRRRRFGRRAGRMALAIVMISAVLSAMGVTIANAAAGTVSALSLSIVSDGTTPFDADDAPGNDSGAANGTIRTGDSLTYQWAYSVSVAGDIVFQQALPAGARWDAASTTDCAEGAAAIAGQTLTCTILNAPAGAGAYNVSAKIVGAANGAVLATNVSTSTGGITSSTASVTVSAAPKVAADLYVPLGTTPSYAVGIGANSGVPGYRFPYSVELYSLIDPAKGVRGLEALSSPFTFTMSPPAGFPSAVPFDCAAGNWSQTLQPGAGGGGTNAVISSGVWACAQPGGPGTPVTVTVTGANSTLDTYPSRGQNGGSLLDATKAFFAVANFSWWVPQSTLPPGAIYTMTTQLSDLDPTGLSGSSNYADGYAPAQAPGAACVTTKNPSSNCANSILNATLTNLIPSAGLVQAPTNVVPIPGASGTNLGDGVVAAGQKYATYNTVQNRPANGPVSGIILCSKWDPSSSTIDPAVAMRVATTPAGLRFVVEYGNQAFADDAARRAGTCGAAGDPDWFTSIDAAGGPGAVTQVRARLLDSFPAGSGLATLYTPMVRTGAALPVGSPVAFFTGNRSVQAGTQASTYNPATNGNSNLGGRALAVEALVRNTVAWDAGQGAPGDVRKVIVSPTVSTPDAKTGATAQDVRVTVTLPSSCTAYQIGSASIAPTSVSPLPAGPCTGGTGSAGQTIVFELGPWPVNTPVPPITFNTVVSPLIATPSTQTVTSTISSASDLTTDTSGLRKASATLPVNALAAFGVTKTSSATTATPGVPYTYTIGWSNRLSTSAGTGSFVDVLPFSGDSRGTTGLTGLSVETVTTSTPSVAVWYTADPPASVQAAVAADPSGMTGVSWSLVKPATVTAIQFRTGELTPGTVQSADITVTPAGLSRTGTIKNDVWGRATAIPSPVQGAALVSMTSSAAELSGNVYDDLDYSFSKSADDTNRAAATVAITGGYAFGADLIDHGGTIPELAVTTPITVTTDAAGDYVFPGVAPGRYTVEVTPPVGWHVAVAPAQPLTLAPSATVTGQDFGLQQNLAPSAATDDEVDVATGSPGSVIDVLANDVIGDPSIRVTETGATSAGGTVAIASDGLSVSYTPAAGFVGDDTFTYTITDKARQEWSATVTVHVLAGAAALDDSAQTGEEVPVAVDVLANDSGVDLAVTDIGANADGTIADDGDGDGTLVFTPNAGFTGVTTFTYQVTDALGRTAEATVTITVIARPVARDDTATSAQDAVVTVNVLANDDGTQVGVTSATSADGTVQVNADDTVSFTPAAGFSGDAEVEYTITDAVGQTASATIVIRVIAGPVANPDGATTGQDVPVVIEVLANDTGSDLDVSIAGAPSHGSAAVGADGRVTYTPAAGFAGSDTFQYTVTDPVGQASTATVTVTVVSGPTAVDDSAITAQDTAVDIDLLGNDVGDTLALVDAGTSPDGAIVDNGDGTITFTPNTGFAGRAEFAYTTTDAFGNASTGTVVILVVARPVAVDDSASTPQEQTVAVDVLLNDTGTGLSVTSVDGGGDGTATINPDGTVAFTPRAGFAGDTAVTYTVTDVVGQSATGTIRVHVTATPVANPDATTIPMSTPVTVAVLGNDTGEAISLSGLGDVTGGTAAINPDGTITFTPADGFSGDALIPYTITDGIGQTASSTLTVTVVAPPTAPDVHATTTGATPITVNPLEGVTGASVQISGIGTTPDGDAVLNPDGTVTFTARDGFSGDASFTYTVVDEYGQAAVGLITITVIAPPNPPDPPNPPNPDGGGGGAADPGGDGLARTGSVVPWPAIGVAALLILLGAAIARGRRRDYR
ncbi:beta strand repeat-containing protein [Microbacterium sp. NPDC090218]